jgi:hypothetical protein
VARGSGGLRPGWAWVGGRLIRVMTAEGTSVAKMRIAVVPELWFEPWRVGGDRDRTAAAGVAGGAAFHAETAENAEIAEKIFGAFGPRRVAKLVLPASR